MNLAIDIGNTTVKLGLFEGEQLQELFTGENAIQSVFEQHSSIKGVIFSKTGTDNSIENYLLKNNISHLKLSHRLALPVKILYQTPETLGPDRIAGSVAAHSLFPHQVALKIDFGTCITYDIIEQGRYLGGAISPGMAMRFKALNHYTAGLPLLNVPEQGNFELIGTNTSTSMISGVVNGIINEVEGIIKNYELRFASLKVVGTGGDMPFFGALLKNEIFVRPNLVLEGLNTILNYNS